MRKNAFMLHNYIELERVEKDRAVFKLDIRPESCNPYGLIHGGAIYTLADNATGAAAHSRSANAYGSSRHSGMDMHRGPPRPRESSALGMVWSRMPASSRARLVT